MIRYSGKASYKDCLNADVRASALLGLLQYRYIYGDEADSGLFLAGIKIRSRLEAEKNLKAEAPDTAGSDDSGADVDKKTSLVDKIRSFTDFISDEENLTALRSIKTVILKIVKHIFPKQITGNITFGLNDPYLTGKVVEIFALIYTAMGDDLRVYPVWDDTIIDGEIDFRGRISIIYMLFQICRLRFNRNCMKLWRKYHG